ncbi:MAG: sensor domain-containing diguanylate cyclase [Acidimicrobiales bacterium]|nr:sensor domain-containing diguanylate cyclase [Acidimicrobiales bacterium]
MVSEVPYRLMVESTFSPFVVTDPHGTVVWVGPKIEDLMGEPAASFVGRHMLETVAPEYHEVALSAFEDYIGEVVPIAEWTGPPMDLELVRADGARLPCEISAAVGTQYGFDGLFLQIRRSQGTTRLYDAVDAMAVGAPVDDVLRRLAALCEYDMPGSSVTIGWGWDGDRFAHAAPDLSHLGASVTQIEPEQTPWRDAMETGTVQGGHELHIDHPALACAVEGSGYATCWAIPITVRGDERPSAAVILWRRSPGGATPHHQTIPQRVSRLAAFALESERHHAELEAAATTDELTGLANRAAQRRSLADVLRRQHTTMPDTSVLFCDLDDFKPVNDRYGHDFGDRVLRIVARRLAETVRDSAHVSRWGGDEFVIVCEGTGEEDIVTLARRLIDTVSAPIGVDGRTILVGLTVGIAHANVGSNVDELLRRADDALRTAKTTGKNRWLVAH